MDIGYDKPLYILPFDHRSGFLKILGLEGKLTAQQSAAIVDYKKIIYEGFVKALALGVPKQYAAILVDEQFGLAILTDARTRGYTTCLTTEKSGQDEFSLEYGKAFGAHIEKVKPTFVKALVRYNPGANPDVNARQRQHLTQLSEYCHANGYYFLFELLVPATTEQLDSVGGAIQQYDAVVRPALMTEAVAELQKAGIEPDIWKVEGLASGASYAQFVKQVRADGRAKVGTIVLGRNASESTVDSWLAEAATVEGITGFAVGRTIFAEPLEHYRDGQLTRDAVSTLIAQHYYHYYQIFNRKK